MRARKPTQIPNDERDIHESVASLLSLRREGIIEAVGGLQSAGAIQSYRGKIMRVDRDRLEFLACECYGVVKNELQRLSPKFYVENFSFERFI